jgi:hypothetical protein
MRQRGYSVPQRTDATLGWGLLEGNLYLCITARRGRIHCVNYKLNVRPKLPPLLPA